MQSAFYLEYMKSEAWAEKKRQRMEIDHNCCVMCGRPAEKTKSGLQVHHVTYKRLGHEDVYNDLCALCASCHLKIHRYYDRERGNS